MLLPKQKKELFKLIEQYALDPGNFQWEEKPTSRATTSYAYGEELPRLVYKGTDFYFAFEYRKKKYNAVYCPGKTTFDDSLFGVIWNVLLNHFTVWLRCLKREIEQPDLWEELLKSKFASDTSEISNEQFTEQEQIKISEGINNIRAYIESEFTHLKDQSAFVNEQLDYLVSASKRLGKKDWILMSIGTITSLALKFSMSSEQANTIWEFIKSSLIGIIQLLPSPPPGI